MKCVCRSGVAPYESGVGNVFYIDCKSPVSVVCPHQSTEFGYVFTLKISSPLNQYSIYHKLTLCSSVLLLSHFSTFLLTCLKVLLFLCLFFLFCICSQFFFFLFSFTPLFLSFAPYLPFHLFYFFKSLVLNSSSTVLGDVIFKSNLNHYSDNYHKKLLVRVLLWYQKLKLLAFPCPDGMWPTVASLGLHKEQQYCKTLC